MNRPRILRVRVGHDSDGSGWLETSFMFKFGLVYSIASGIALAFCTTLPRKIRVRIWVGLQVLALIIVGVIAASSRLENGYCAAIYAFGILLGMVLGLQLLEREEKSAVGGSTPAAGDEGASSDGASTEAVKPDDPDVWG